MEGGGSEEGPIIYEGTMVGHYIYIASHNLILAIFYNHL